MLLAALAAVAGTAGGAVLVTHDWETRGAAESEAAGSGGTGSPPAEPGTTQPPETYGAPVVERPEPSDVATDAPVEVAQTGSDVPVHITYKGWEDATGSVEVGAYVEGLVEDGGTCTLILTQGGTEVTASASGLADASTTSCGAGLSVPGAELTPGTWTAVVDYESSTSSGSSDSVEVEVP